MKKVIRIIKLGTTTYLKVEKRKDALSYRKIRKMEYSLFKEEDLVSDLEDDLEKAYSVICEIYNQNNRDGFEFHLQWVVYYAKLSNKEIVELDGDTPLMTYNEIVWLLLLNDANNIFSSDNDEINMYEHWSQYQYHANIENQKVFKRTLNKYVENKELYLKDNPLEI
jgi:hypothetical protein